MHKGTSTVYWEDTLTGFAYEIIVEQVYNEYLLFADATGIRLKVILNATDNHTLMKEIRVPKGIDFDVIRNAITVAQDNDLGFTDGLFVIGEVDFGYDMREVEEKLKQDADVLRNSTGYEIILGDGIRIAGTD